MLSENTAMNASTRRERSRIPAVYPEMRPRAIPFPLPFYSDNKVSLDAAYAVLDCLIRRRKP